MASVFHRDLLIGRLCTWNPSIDLAMVLKMAGDKGTFCFALLYDRWPCHSAMWCNHYSAATCSCVGPWKPCINLAILGRPKMTLWDMKQLLNISIPQNLGKVTLKRWNSNSIIFSMSSIIWNMSAFAHGLGVWIWISVAHIYASPASLSFCLIMTDFLKP